MAVNLVNLKVDENKLTLDDCVMASDGKPYRVGDLFIRNREGKYVHPANVEELKNALNSTNNIFLPNLSNVNARSKTVFNFQNNTKTFHGKELGEFPTTIVSRDFVKKNEVVELGKGASRTYSLASNSEYSDADFLMIRIEGSREFLMIHKSKIVLSNGLELKTLVNATDITSFADLAKYELYYQNEDGTRSRIDSVVGRAFTATKLLEYEQVKIEGSENSYSKYIAVADEHIRIKLEGSDGLIEVDRSNVVYKDGSTYQQINSDDDLNKELYYKNEHGNYVKITQTSQHVETTREDIVPNMSEQVYNIPDNDIKVTNYRLDNDGDFINVTVLNEVTQSPVAIEDLYVIDGNKETPIIQRDESGKVSDDFDYEKLDLSLYIGKSLLYKKGDMSVMTEPLTYAQASIRYSRVNTYAKIDDNESILDLDSEGKEKGIKEGIYLRLTDGSYIEERKVARPICYEFVTETDPSKLEELKKRGLKVLATVDGQSKIISEATFQEGIKGKVIENSQYIIPSTKSMSECDVVQTTSSKDNITESCVVLSALREKINIATKEEDKEKAKEEFKSKYSEIRQNFLRDYSQGKYELDTVLLPGNEKESARYVPLNDDNAYAGRYKKVNQTRMEFYAENDEKYQTIKIQNLEERNGKIVGARVSQSQALAKDISKAYKDSGKLMKFLVNACAHPLVAFAFSPIIIGAGVLNFLGKTAVGLIKAGVNSVKTRNRNKELQNLAELQRKGAKAKLDSDLAETMTNLADNKNITLDTYQQFKDAMRRVEYDLMKESDIDYKAVFTWDGNAKKGIVHKGNVTLSMEFMDRVSELESELEDLTEQCKADPKNMELQNKLSLTKDKLAAMKQHYTSSNLGSKVSFEEYKARWQKVQAFKGFMLCKHFARMRDVKTGKVNSYNGELGNEFRQLALKINLELAGRIEDFSENFDFDLKQGKIISKDASVDTETLEKIGKIILNIGKKFDVVSDEVFVHDTTKIEDPMNEFEEKIVEKAAEKTEEVVTEEEAKVEKEKTKVKSKDVAEAQKEETDEEKATGNQIIRNLFKGLTEERKQVIGKVFFKNEKDMIEFINRFKVKSEDGLTYELAKIKRNTRYHKIYNDLLGIIRMYGMEALQTGVYDTRKIPQDHTFSS